MKRMFTAATAILVLTGSAGGALADPGYHPDRHVNGHRVHHDWRKGGRIARADWNRGHRVDYRQRHLRAPPRGYEWREVDGSYVLAAAATGLIAGLLIANQ